MGHSHLGYGVTNDVDLVGVERLEDFAVKIPGFTFFTCVAAENSAYPRKGYVPAHVESGHLNGGDIDAYVCGPPPMVDAVRGWLAEQSVTPANFYYEKIHAERCSHFDRRSPAGSWAAQILVLEDADDCLRQLMLHAGRSALGAAAVLIFLWALY